MNQRTAGCVLATVLIVLGSAASWATTLDEEAFLTAVAYGNLEQVQRYLKAGGNVDDVRGLYPEETPALVAAAAAGHTDVVAALLAAGANPDNSDNYGVTALVAAAAAGHASVVTALLQGGANLHFRAYYRGDTALLVAAAAGHAAVVTALLEGGADPNFPNRLGDTALQVVMEAGHEAITDILRTAGAVPNKNRHNMALLYAAAMLDMGGSGADMAAAALEAGADPNFRDDAGRTALMNAMLSDCGHGRCDEELVTALLANGADPNLQDEDGNTALMLVAREALAEDIVEREGWTVYAALRHLYREDYGDDPFTHDEMQLGVLRENNPHIVLFVQLLKSGADPTLPNKAGDTVVKVAEARGEAVLADVLREAGGDPKFGLLRAAAKGDGAEVAELLAGGAAVGLQSGDGRTALRLAAQAGHGTVVAELLAGGAVVNLQSGNERTALMDAATNGHAEVVTALLAAGADPNVSDDSGNTALIYATWRTGNSEVIRALLVGGADPNTRGKWVTALENTVRKGDVEAVVALLAGGADPNLQDEDGDTALKLAEKEGHSAIAGMLRKAGAADAERPRELRNSIGMEFVLIEPGTFEMGSPETEPGRKDDETLRTVTITQPFYLGKYEVTQGQWQAVMGNNPSRFSSCGQNCPVETVSWEDVQEFIRELNRREGTEGYRLPTEAEWEFAARGGRESRGYVYAGSDRLDSVGWCADGSDVGASHPVGQKRPNELGLYDMSGNVLEWVQNWLGSYPSGALTNPRGPSTGDHRIVRGGSWRRPARWCRAAHYASAAPSTRYIALGFRLVRTP